ncbi:MAG: hypothetical protein RL385_1086 [Pseudomonadota bacterium]|jgi:hypothetical protein
MISSLLCPETENLSRQPRRPLTFAFFLLAARLTAGCSGHDSGAATQGAGPPRGTEIPAPTAADAEGGPPERAFDAAPDLSPAPPTPDDADASANSGRDPKELPDAGSAEDAGEDLDAAVIVPDASRELGAGYAARDAGYLFEPDTLHTFELYLTRRDLATLDADPAAEKYVPGTLIFEGGLIQNVGIRYKGSTGSFIGCLSGGFFPPSGEKTCQKLGMKVKIDHLDKSARFFGQKKVQFHAMNLDGSMLRERFGYTLFNDLGVHAPRSAHVRLMINGKFAGLFLLVEVVDTPFIEHNFPEDSRGNLYKEAWPTGTDEARYLAALEASSSAVASASKMVALASALETATDATLPSVVEHWFDLDYAARFIAIDRAIRHDDGPHHWYCGSAIGASPWHLQRTYADTHCGNHNYYFYESATSERLWPIPWDLDLSDAVGTGIAQVLTQWDDLNADCTMVVPGSFGGGQMPITCDPLHRGFALSLRARVQTILQSLAAGPLSETEIDAKLARWQAQIEPVLAESIAAYPSTPSLETWRLQVQAMRAALLQHRDEALSHVAP